MNASEHFKKNKYVYLSDVTADKECRRLTNHMFQLFQEGKTKKDTQCTLSESIYGDPLFDNLLEVLSKPLSQLLGIQLLPTVSYARLYRPGEVLEKHTDRRACEISATMTLGHDEKSNIWPIYLGENDEDEVGKQVIIEVGDLLMYRGNELKHWRPKYKGEWQVQVFFHYVDANGPYADQAYDKREKAESTLDKFSKSSEVNEFKLNSSIIDNGIMIRTCDDVFPGAATYHREFNSQYTFTPEECQKILQQSEKLYPEKSKIGADSGVYDPKVRSVDTYQIELTDETRWIFNKICTAVGKVNSEYYKFDLLGITHSLQLLHYKATENGHYDWHIDSGPGSCSTRKISLSIPLTERDAYEGGNLEINDQGEEIKAIDEQGSITFFPSYALHRVSPVTKGERWVIVAWVHGPNRFR